MKQCELKTNVDAKIFFVSEISKMDTEIIQLNLSKPALRALIRLKIYTLLDLSEISRESLINAHGMGPSSIIKINCLLDEAIQKH
jgi:hypothetical protein